MDAKYYQEHREEIRAKQREYYNKNKEKFAEKNKNWRKANSEHIAEYLDKNRERRKMQDKLWRESNKEKLAEKMKEYRKENPLTIKKIEANRNRPVEQKIKFNVYHKRWRSENPDKLIQYSLNRRSRLARGNNDLTELEIKEQRELQKGKCYYCGKSLDNNGRGHVEHKIPLCRGGENTKSNIVIACSHCNLEKSQKTEEEYYEYLSNRPR